jgi:BirA family biotin operon repressor/biotin-[acetyl-CoA-carboxylase] ligase
VDKSGKKARSTRAHKDKSATAGARTSGALSEKNVRSLIGDIPCELAIYSTIDSTLDEAKRLIDAASSPGDIPFKTIIVAEEQTAGRGRMGRPFFSPAADSVYISFILRPATEIKDTLLITIMAAVAVCEAIENVAGAKPRIKWVNDIFIGRRKVSGILTEAISTAGSGAIDVIALGIGVNVNAPREIFPDELQKVVGAVDIDPDDRCVFAAELIKRVSVRYEELIHGKSPIDDYRKRSLVIGKEAMIVAQDGTESIVIVEGIADDGSLVVRYENGKREALNSGDIRLRIDVNRKTRR